MNITPAIVLTDAMLTSSVTENDADDGTVWAAGTYAAGSKVRRPDHHSYEAATAITGADGPPEDNIATTPPKWIDLGYTNMWRMLKTDSDQQTVGTSTLVVTITPGQRVAAVGVVGLEADAIRVTTSDGFDSGTRSLRTRDTRKWSDYFYGAFQYRNSTLFFNLPRTTTSVIAITITRVTGNVLCGPVVVGTPIYLGRVLGDVEKGQRDYSSISADPSFGIRKLIQKKAISLLSPTSVIPDDQVVTADRTLTNQRATIAFFTCLDDPVDPRFDLYSLLGLCTDFKVKPGNGFSTLTFALEGF